MSNSLPQQIHPFLYTISRGVTPIAQTLPLHTFVFRPQHLRLYTMIDP